MASLRRMPILKISASISKLRYHSSFAPSVPSNLSNTVGLSLTFEMNGRFYFGNIFSFRRYSACGGCPVPQYLEFAQLKGVSRAVYRKSQILGHNVKPVTLSKISLYIGDISFINSSANFIFFVGCIKQGVRNLSPLNNCNGLA